MLSEEKWRQYGVSGNKLRGIVVHNTNNQKMSAKDLEYWLENECRTSQGCHYIVDHEEVRQIMPLSWSAFNVGNGMQFGNTDCIAIEICSNPSTKKYLAGQSKAIDLIEELMEKYDLTCKDIYFHRDFQPNINCPAQILQLYGDKQTFLSLLKGAK